MDRVDAAPGDRDERWVLDDAAIRRLVVSLSFAMDERDVAGFRAAFADEVELDLPRLAPNAPLLRGRRPADDYARDVIALLTPFAMTQHVTSNHLVEVDGDRATCACYVVAEHHLPDALLDDGDRLTAGARYDLGLRRVAGGDGWRIDRFRLTPMWSRGAAGLWAVAAGRIEPGRAGRSGSSG